MAAVPAGGQRVERRRNTRPEADSAFAPSTLERQVDQPVPTRWTGWRLRLLLLATVLGCLGALAFAHWLAATPWLDVNIGVDDDGTLVLARSQAPDLEAWRGQHLRALGSAADATGTGTGISREILLDATLLQPSTRWQADDARRARLQQQHAALAGLFGQGRVGLLFEGAPAAQLATPPRGGAGLGWALWPLLALALTLVLLSVVVVLARPQARNALYLLMAWCQAAQLLFLAAQTLPGIGAVPPPFADDMPWRLALDCITAAAAVQAFGLHPRRLPHAGRMAALTWALAAAGVGFITLRPPPHQWWWAQVLTAALGLMALFVITRSHRIEHNPFAVVIRRLTLGALVAWLLVTVVVAGVAAGTALAAPVVLAVSALWTLGLSALLLLAPFVARSRQVLRECALLAGAGTLATGLHLLFVSVFAIGATTSLTLAVLLALGAYAGARQWVLNSLAGRSVLTTERTFEQLYRVARELQVHPARYPLLLGQLLRDLFEPLELLHVDRRLARSAVVGGGSALVVPVRSTARSGSRAGADDSHGPSQALVLRFARRGQRLFTDDDARLAERVVEQLRRAVAYDKAVERGRSEERLRIAQDLHDDIGARLLTLMYQAQTPEMEDYIRHTLQDLKTLTRGLAASEHRLSHAAAEWKADLTQRLSVAQVTLLWTFTHDRELTLTVVQWSALTRVLRELVSNALYHAQAAHVEVALTLQGNGLTLRVADDGIGRAPEAWSHGLGLGGVRKRVKALGGEVRWRENQPGIVCEVQIAEFVRSA